MLTFLDSGHKFTVAAGNARQLMEFGNRLFFTTLVGGMPIQQMEQVIANGGSLFSNGLIFPAITFDAECVVLMPKETSAQFPELQLRNDFDFGFVQGIRASNVNLEYWGQIKDNGRSILQINMPSVFEVDTDTSMQPFTRAASSRFEIRNITQADSKFNSLKVSSNFFDHPLYTFPHTVTHTLPTSVTVPHFIRSVAFRREFRTIFCFRNKKDGSFTPISSTEWAINYNQIVNYSQNGATRNPVSNASPSFPSRGNPSNVDETDRQIMAMAKAGLPLMTPVVLQTRMGPAGSRIVTRENTNPDFVASFWT